MCKSLNKHNCNNEQYKDMPLLMFMLFQHNCSLTKNGCCGCTFEFSDVVGEAICCGVCGSYWYIRWKIGHKAKSKILKYQYLGFSI